MYEIFSKRQKKQRGEIPDVYQYTELPINLRTQFIHVINDILLSEFRDKYRQSAEDELEKIHRILLKEYGLFNLSGNANNPIRDLKEFIYKEENIELVIDAIELICRSIPNIKDPFDSGRIKPNEAILEINKRFVEAGVGFKYENGYVLKFQSDLLHQETVINLLKLLTKKDQIHINNEFMLANEHFRHGRYSESISESLKAFESSLKYACEKKGFKYDKNKDTAKKLIDILVNNKFFPTFMESYLGNIRSILETGIPTTRNRTSGHGKGVDPKIENFATETLAIFILNITGSSIKFILNTI